MINFGHLHKKLEVNTLRQVLLKPSPTTQIPEKAFPYTNPNLVKPQKTQSTEKHPPSKLETNQCAHKELSDSPPAQRLLVISLPTQGTVEFWASAQKSRIFTI